MAVARAVVAPAVAAEPAGHAVADAPVPVEAVSVVPAVAGAVAGVAAMEGGSSGHSALSIAPRSIEGRALRGALFCRCAAPDFSSWS